MKKNVLIVLTDLPYPLEHGGDQAMFNNVACVKDECNVYCVYRGGIKKNYFDKKEALEKIWGNVKIYPYIETEKGKSAWGLFNQIVKEIKMRFFNKNPFYRMHRVIESFDVAPYGFYNFIEKLIKELKIDIVQIEMLQYVNLVLALPPSVKTVLVHHEIRFVTNELNLSRFPKDQIFNYRKACVQYAKIYEIGVLNKFDAIVTLSYTDSQKLMNAGVTSPIYTSRAIVNTQIPEDIISDDGHVLTYVGPESHYPNVLAVKWFLENCWNSLLKEDNKYVFRIIGKWSENTIKKIKSEYLSVEFTGFVENLHSAIQNTVSIIPLTVGSGIRMKILEAATIGVPFISTTVGVEGLPFVNGEDCFVDDEPQTFVEDILKLRDKSLRLQFIRSAQEKVKFNYSFGALRNDRLAMYEELLRT